MVTVSSVPRERLATSMPTNLAQTALLDLFVAPPQRMERSWQIVSIPLTHRIHVQNGSLPGTVTVSSVPRERLATSMPTNLAQTALLDLFVAPPQRMERSWQIVSIPATDPSYPCAKWEFARYCYCEQCRSQGRGWLHNAYKSCMDCPAGSVRGTTTKDGSVLADCQGASTVCGHWEFARYG
jgi:hypothetical protein